MARPKPMRAIDVGIDIREFGNALKSAGIGSKDAGIGYTRLSPTEKARFVQTVDRFIDELIEAWDALRLEVLEIKSASNT